MNSQMFDKFQRDLLDQSEVSLKSSGAFFGSFFTLFLSAGLLATATDVPFQIWTPLLWLWAWSFLGGEACKVVMRQFANSITCPEIKEDEFLKELDEEGQKLFLKLNWARHQGLVSRVARERRHPLRTTALRSWRYFVDVVLLISLFVAGSRVLLAMLALFFFVRWYRQAKARSTAYHYVRNLTPARLQYISNNQ